MTTLKQTVNIYCDESCHLENTETAMVLGALSVPKQMAYRHNVNLRKIKMKFDVSAHCELKWTKVSPAQLAMYQEILDYYFLQPELQFRALVIPDKKLLSHEKFGQTHDYWYYKMYYNMLKTIIRPEYDYNIYLDIKDTCSKNKTNKLHDVLCSSKYDFDKKIIKRIAVIKSHEVELMGVADLLIGALGYLHRNLHSSTAKQTLIAQIKNRTGMNLRSSSLPGAQKFNLFIWQPQREGE
jgi:hypothetical protein